MAVEDLDINGSISGGQLRRVIDGLKAVAARRIHQSTLVTLARSQWFPVERMSVESDGQNVYLRFTLKIVIGRSDEKVGSDE